MKKMRFFCMMLALASVLVANAQNMSKLYSRGGLTFQYPTNCVVVDEDVEGSMRMVQIEHADNESGVLVMILSLGNEQIDDSDRNGLLLATIAELKGAIFEEDASNMTFGDYYWETMGDNLKVTQPFEGILDENYGSGELILMSVKNTIVIEMIAAFGDNRSDILSELRMVCRTLVYTEAFPNTYSLEDLTFQYPNHYKIVDGQTDNGMYSVELEAEEGNTGMLINIIPFGEESIDEPTKKLIIEQMLAELKTDVFGNDIVNMTISDVIWEKMGDELRATQSFKGMQEGQYGEGEFVFVAMRSSLMMLVSASSSDNPGMEMSLLRAVAKSVVLVE